MTRIHLDTSELDMLGAWLRESGPKVNRAAPGIVRRGAVNIKNEWRDAASKSRSFRGIASTISFDEKRTPDVIEAEIGPNRYFRAARLAGIAHFGGANGGGGTIGDPARFLENEAPGFEKAIADLIDEALS